MTVVVPLYLQSLIDDATRPSSAEPTDEEMRVMFAGQPAMPQRKPETGERLIESAPSRKGSCYFCGKDAAVKMAGQPSACMSCHERWRRRD